MRPITVDGNEAVARVAYRLSEVIAIYPITPSSPMAELSDEWASKGEPNLLGLVPKVVEMQSEGGAAGALHGALQEGTLATTFTSSQGLLLMIPDMFKIAGQALPGVIHVAARALATHALSIFGDHQDLYAVRPTGWAILVSESVQAVQDLAAIAHLSALKASLPFLHAMDGFRTSHEVQKITPLSDRELKALFPWEALEAFRRRALTPEAPVIRGTAQNPDHYFQNREAINPYYDRLPGVVQEVMDRFAEVTARRYEPYEYFGHPEAERVVVVMGSASLAVEEAVEHLLKRGERVGMVRVRLFRPFHVEAFLKALPHSATKVAVLDRGKEPGAVGEPLFQEVAAALALRGGDLPVVVGGRYGLSSKEFTPAMALGVFEELKKERPRHGFTVGIVDDLTMRSLPYPEVDFEDPASVRAVFFALGSDGTVSANKNTIKIIGEETSLFAQGYFVYDSKKSGSRTVSHLRFGPNPLEKILSAQSRTPSHPLLPVEGLQPPHQAAQELVGHGHQGLLRPLPPPYQRLVIRPEFPVPPPPHHRPHVEVPPQDPRTPPGKPGPPDRGSRLPVDRMQACVCSGRLGLPPDPRGQVGQHRRHHP
jgi:pyruvate-ferredoxin/flavodoxin oxidoreductase